MILYMTDRHGNQYEAEVVSEVNEVEGGTYTDPKVVIDRWVNHHVKVTGLVGEFNFSSSQTDDPADVLHKLYELIEREING